MAKTLSIVIPIYNVYDFLDECLEKLVPNDKYKNRVEVLCVDDCTPDNSMEIVDKYITAYPDVFKKTKNKENSKLGPTRINGVKQCETDYTFFIDSDDYVVDDFYDIVFSELDKNEDFDLYIFDFTWMRLGGRMQYCKPQKMNKYKYAFNWEGHVFWNKLYKTDAVKTIQTTPLTHEDFISFPEVIDKMPNYKLVHKNILWYREREGSITTQISEKERIAKRKASLDEVIAINGYNREIHEYVYTSLFFNLDFMRVFTNDYEIIPNSTIIIDADHEVNPHLLNVFSENNILQNSIEIIIFGKNCNIFDNYKWVSKKITKTMDYEKAMKLISPFSNFFTVINTNSDINWTFWDLYKKAVYGNDEYSYILSDKYSYKVISKNNSNNFITLKNPSAFVRKSKKIIKKIIGKR